MLNKLVHVVAICSDKIIKQITHFDFPMKIEELDHGLALKKFLLAASWHYENTTKHQAGDLILGINGAENIKNLAKILSAPLGLQDPIDDETTLDLFREFFNNIIGHTNPAWEQLALPIKLHAPKIIENLEVIKGNFDLKCYLVTLTHSKKNIQVQLTIILKNPPILNKRILCVDDSKTMRLIYTTGLKKAGYVVDEASDGKQALQKFIEFQPDLTIMDLNMPEIGGLDAIFQLKEKNPNAKFFVVSSSLLPDEMNAAKTLSIDRYLIKPIDIEKLVMEVNTILKKT